MAFSSILNRLPRLNGNHSWAPLLVGGLFLGIGALVGLVGSTSKLLKAAVERPEQTFIVATDQGILHEMRKQAPHKTFLAAPTAGNGGTCKSCAFCPWMAMNGLVGIHDALRHGHNEILLDSALGQAARKPLERMLKQAGQSGPTRKPVLEINPDHPLVQRLKSEDGRFDDWSSLLLDQATLADGGKLEDPVGFVRRMNDLLLASSH